MTQKLIMVKGLPASWKSTWAKEFVKNTKNSTRINNDDLRASFYWRKFDKDDESLIASTRDWIIWAYLQRWYTVVVDNTNLNPIHYDSLSYDAKRYGAIFEVKEFAVDVDTCIARDKLRGEDSVGAKVIRDMAKKWNYYPKPPREFDIIDQDGSLPTAYIFDIDGTLAYMNWRSPYDYTKVNEDWVHEDVRWILHILKSAWAKIIICSWRSDSCHAETALWLHENKIPYTHLYMRKDWDTRKDSIIKHEILKERILPKYYVSWVFDDRQQVVDMYRECWIRVYQVAYGDF